MATQPTANQPASGASAPGSHPPTTPPPGCLYGHIAHNLCILAIRLPYRIFVIGIYWSFWEPFFCTLINLGFFLWTSVMVFTWRTRGRDCMESENELAEDEWGFGQITALVLFVSPFVANCDIWYDVMDTGSIWSRIKDKVEALRAWPKLKFLQRRVTSSVELPPVSTSREDLVQQQNT
ncbi:hypothetical protein F5X68DRAFT_210757 [Plectosphaerella plurivora]|uniref:Uncharacterized protein n=1 Tax=Plectosphaerella plurivora TaxID=936078 RepID=A0A9P8V8N1_9PEZI|nr:hypothetical protein F5X68DRAFT_210757 [Plectosphaerella plurivora]